MKNAATLELIAVDAELAYLVREDHVALAVLLRASIPDAWPSFPHAFAAERFKETPGREQGSWGGFLFLDRGCAALVGNGGFKGAPNVAGEVEIGYEVAPTLRRRGYATQATRELVRRAFRDSAVRCVTAHTLASSLASAGVLNKCGFQRVAVQADDKLGPIWKWARTRSVLMDVPL